MESKYIINTPFGEVKGIFKSRKLSCGDLPDINVLEFLPDKERNCISKNYDCYLISKYNNEWIEVHLGDEYYGNPFFKYRKEGAKQ